MKIIPTLSLEIFPLIATYENLFVTLPPDSLIEIYILEDYLDKLNEQQRQAVLYTDGPSLVIAGAGSGKTRVLTYKIVHLLNLGYAPYRIMALTFTNKAASEMKERIEPLVGKDAASLLWMGTFHSIFARILRINSEKIGFRHDFTIYDTADSRALIKTIIKDMGLDEKVYKPNSIQAQISNAKNALISPADYENDGDLRRADNRANRPQTFAIYKAYWRRCFIAGAMDFDDLLFYTNILLRDNPDILAKYQEFFQYVLVDEYQDTNFAQHLIVSKLCQVNQKLCVVGDDAQSIYSFRGANISNILNLKKAYPTLATFKLEQNYRSTQNIIEAANSLIEKNSQQIPKHIFSTNSKGSKISVVQAYSDYEESFIVANHIISIKAQQGDAFDDFAVLYRTNAQSRVLEEALRKRNIPYKIYGGLSFYQRKEVKDAISYFRLAINPDDDQALVRVINTPARGIGSTTIGKLQNAAIHHNVSMWQVICDPDKYDVNINSGTKKKLAGFQELIEAFIEQNNAGTAADILAKVIIADTKLIAVLQNDNTPENISKLENLQELINGVDEFVAEKEESGAESVTLNDFLAEVSLDTSEEADNDTGPNVTLMTVHSAKGLEFKNVIIVGVEEDLFPAAMSSDSLYGIEEERRLLYVAITRAKCTCMITYAKSRYKNGQTKECVMSRFIRDIDPRYLNANSSAAASMGGGTSRQSLRHDDFDDERGMYLNDFRQAPAYERISDMPRLSDEPRSRVRLSSEAIAASRATTVAAKAPAATSVGSGDYTSHSAGELTEGCRIEHSRFGNGIVSQIDTSGADAKIVVNFSDIGTKTLLLKFAKFRIIND